MPLPTLPPGVWPAMLTPLLDDYSIDWANLDALTDFYIEAGVAGLFAVGQSSEMFYMTDEERLAVAQRVVKHTNGRVPIVATGTFGGPIKEQAAFVRQMIATGVDSITVITGAMAESTESDAQWISHVEELLDYTGDIPLALYECPQPYHRTITAELAGWAAQTGRFTMLKETSRSLEQVQAKVDAATGTDFHVYNADATTLLDSIRGGAYGYCGISANYAPDLLVWLCANPDHALAETVQAALTTVDPMFHHKYPIAAKVYRQQAGMPINALSRVHNNTPDAYERRTLSAAAAVLESVRQQLN